MNPIFLRILIGVTYAALIYSITFVTNEDMQALLGVFLVAGALGVFLALLVGPDLSFRRLNLLILSVIGVLSLILLIIEAETLICLVVAAPVVWLISAGSGYAMLLLLRRIEQTRMNSAVLAALPVALLLATPYADIAPNRYEVVTEITINASPDAIWPLTRSIDTISDAERPFTVTHNLLASPRPLDAMTRDGVRYASWTKGVHFEEHVTHEVPEQSLIWTFAFPDPTAIAPVDTRLSPEGPEVRLIDGRYDLIPETDGATILRLTTRYDLQAPLPFYFAAWGRLFLNDYHRAVLHVVKSRAEAA